MAKRVVFFTDINLSDLEDEVEEFLNRGYKILDTKFSMAYNPDLYYDLRTGWMEFGVMVEYED